MDNSPLSTPVSTPETQAVPGPAIGLGDLTRVVGVALGRASVSLAAWAVHPLTYTVRNSVSAGLYRVQGTAAGEGAPGAPAAWSVILKVVQPQDTDLSGDPTHWNYWKREFLAYQSGALETLILAAEPGAPGLALPRCWEVEEKPDGRVWIWLEDVADGGEWTLDRFGLAARHFGRFQSGFLTGRPLPVAPWVSRGWMRARVASFADSLLRLHDPAVWANPLVRRTCPRSLEERLARLWAERGDFLDALDRLPQTLCHLDLWRPNLLSRAVPSGVQTVALDWSYTGLGAVGQDIGNLVPDSLGNFDVGVDQAAALDQTVFDGYVQGLREQGWTGDARQVRLGYTAAAALGWGLGTPWWLVWPEDAARQAQIERQWGRPLEELLAQRAQFTGFVLDLAEEARALLRQGVLSSAAPEGCA